MQLIVRERERGREKKRKEGYLSVRVLVDFQFCVRTVTVLERKGGFKKFNTRKEGELLAIFSTKR
jgi:hypothetical protein